MIYFQMVIQAQFIIVKNIKKIKPGTFLEIDNNFQK